MEGPQRLSVASSNGEPCFALQQEIVQGRCLQQGRAAQFIFQPSRRSAWTSFPMGLAKLDVAVILEQRLLRGFGQSLLFVAELLASIRTLNSATQMSDYDDAMHQADSPRFGHGCRICRIFDVS